MTTVVVRTGGVLPDSVKRNFRLFGLDGLLTEGSKFIFDPLDTNCWPNQDTPSSGETLTNLVSGGSVATFNASPPAYTSGGFVLPGGSSSANVRFPTTGKVASGVEKFLAIYWIYHGTQGVSSGSHFVCGIGGQTSNMQYGVYMSGNGSNGNLNFIGNGQLIASVSGAAAQMFQVAVGLEKNDDDRFVLTAWKNGALVGSYTQAGGVTSIVQPSQTIPSVGAYSLVGGDSLSTGTWIGRFHRAVFDTLDGEDAISDLVARDFALNRTRMGL